MSRHRERSAAIMAAAFVAGVLALLLAFQAIMAWERWHIEAPAQRSPQVIVMPAGGGGAWPTTVRIEEAEARSAFWGRGGH